MDAFTPSNSKRTYLGASMSEQIKQEIDKEIGENKILVYGKGTKDMPRCGAPEMTARRSSATWSRP